jgi:hypothetical protein
MVCLFSKVICVFLLNQNDSIMENNIVFKKIEFLKEETSKHSCFARLPAIES